MRARRIVNGGNARASGMRHVRGPAAVVAGSRRREREREELWIGARVEGGIKKLRKW